MKHSCPICRRPTDSETDAEFPFCSERCRLADLGNWASERYVVSEPAFEEDDLEKLLADDAPQRDSEDSRVAASADADPESTPQDDQERSSERHRRYGSRN